MKRWSYILLALVIWLGAAFTGLLLSAIPPVIIPFGIFDRPATWLGYLLPLLLGGGIGGAIGWLVGLLEYLALRHWWPQANRWVLGTSFGWALTYAVYMIFLFTMGNHIIEISGAQFSPTSTVFVLFGLGVGVGQWLALRGQLRQAGWWLFISTISWAATIGANNILSYLGNLTGIPPIITDATIYILGSVFIILPFLWLISRFQKLQFGN